jgi:hypothetical protein
MVSHLFMLIFRCCDVILMLSRHLTHVAVSSAATMYLRYSYAFAPSQSVCCRFFRCCFFRCNISLVFLFLSLHLLTHFAVSSAVAILFLCFRTLSLMLLFLLPLLQADTAGDDAWYFAKKIESSLSRRLKNSGD